MRRSSGLAWHTHPRFLRSYGVLPHRLLNRGLARLTRLKRPAWAVAAAIDAWSRLADIDRAGFEDRSYDSIDDFFLRRIRPGERPLGSGFVSPADGILIDRGTLEAGRTLHVKGESLSLPRIVNAGIHDLSLNEYEGGSFAVVFLTPRGYHRIHAPTSAVLRQALWVPGRFFPQNPVALKHIPRVYERNERAVLRFVGDSGVEFLLVMVGASLIGGIHLEALPRADWTRDRAVSVNVRYEKGQELGHFAFGSTVIVLLPRRLSLNSRATDAVRMGETLFDFDV